MCRSWFLQGCKSSPQEKQTRRHAVWIAIEYSYKLGQKIKLKFLCEHGWFLQKQSHIMGYVFKIEIVNISLSTIKVT